MAPDIFDHLLMLFNMFKKVDFVKIFWLGKYQNIISIYKVFHINIRSNNWANFVKGDSEETIEIEFKIN